MDAIYQSMMARYVADEHLTEVARKIMLAHVSNAVLQLWAVDSLDDTHRRFLGTAFAYLNTNQEPLLLTADHVVNEVRVGEKLCCVSGGDTPATWEAQVVGHLIRADFAVVRSSRQLPQALPGARASIGSFGFVVGFDSVEQQLRLSHGLISDGVPNDTISAHADSGYSGGPIVGASGNFLGMVLGESVSTVTRTTRFLSTKEIIMALNLINQPLVVP
eukprot:jgi/Chlat1/6414/Chrsp45S00460